MRITIYPIFLKISGLCMLLFSACSVPQPVSRLIPLEKNHKWWYGRELIEFPENQGVTLDVVFQKSTPEYLILDVWIQNRSKQTVLVDPLQFSMEGFGRDTSTSLGPAIVALDPEMKLLDLDKRASREIAEGQNSATLELISSTLDVASDLSSVGKNENSAEIAQEMEARDNRTANYETEQAERGHRLGTLEEKRDYWSTGAIRKTSLEPGYQLSGSLFFQRQNNATFLQFRGTIEEREFRLYFRQRLFQP